MRSLASMGQQPISMTSGKTFAGSFLYIVTCTGNDEIGLFKQLCGRAKRQDLPLRMTWGSVSPKQLQSSAFFESWQIVIGERFKICNELKVEMQRSFLTIIGT